jgi:hypothetical protein
MMSVLGKTTMNRVFVFVAVCLLATGGWSDEPPMDTKSATREEIALLIGRLGSKSFVEREAATKQLLNLGAAAPRSWFGRRAASRRKSGRVRRRFSS